MYNLSEIIRKNVKIHVKCALKTSRQDTVYSESTNQRY